MNSDAVVTQGGSRASTRAPRAMRGSRRSRRSPTNAEICALRASASPTPCPTSPTVVAGACVAAGAPEYPEAADGGGGFACTSGARRSTARGLDDATFGHGYGEENDFCMRAGHGWRKRARRRCICRAEGGASFGRSGSNPAPRTSPCSRRANPGYNRSVADFIARDPLAARRARIARDRPELSLELTHCPIRFLHRRALHARVRARDLVRALASYAFASPLSRGQARARRGVRRRLRLGAARAPRRDRARVTCPRGRRARARAFYRDETGACALRAADVHPRWTSCPTSFDLVVSFETLEHVEAQDRMLAGFARVLAPDGLLIISSPDRRTYSDVAGFRNEHHVRELYRDELEALLAKHFPAHRLLGQKLLFQSAIWDLGSSPTHLDAVTARAGGAAVSRASRTRRSTTSRSARERAALPGDWRAASRFSATRRIGLRALQPEDARTSRRAPCWRTGRVSRSRARRCDATAASIERRDRAPAALAGG